MNASSLCSVSQRTWFVPVGLMALLVLGGVRCAPFIESDRNVKSPVVWRTTINESPEGRVSWSGVPTTDGRQVFFSVEADIVSLDVETGRVLWRSPAWTGLRRPRRGNIVLHDGILYAGQMGRVASVSTDGTLRWRAEIDSVNSGGIAVDELAVYGGTRDPHALALDLADGHVLWRTDLRRGWEHQAFVTGVTVSGDTVYVSVDRFLNISGSYRAGVIVALARRTGAELWRLQTPGDHENAASAAAVAGRLLVFSDLIGGSFFAVDRFAVKEVWRVEGDSTSVGPSGTPAVVGDTVFGGSGDRDVFAIHLQTGHVLWKARTRASIDHVAVCGDRVLANNFAVAMVDRRTHKLIGHFLHVTESEPDGAFVTSGFAILGNRAFVSGTHAIFGLQC